ncbi:MAG TPA: hypothetical protein VMT71_05895 [Syntrophorhabdales bacterium]|nr:hypothetical protein [Syntrophorhabdales bacterium]
MSTLAISLIVFGCIFGGTLLGMLLQRLLPKHHLSDRSLDVVKLGTGMLATLAALVIGLLISSARANFDTMRNELISTSSNIILLDRLMAQYGPETKDARDLLRLTVAAAIKRIWSEERMEYTYAKSFDKRVSGMEALQEKLLRLSPQDRAQRWLQSRALQVSGDLAAERWLLAQQIGLSSLPMPFFVILVSWLVIIFFNFGLSSSPNATVIIVLLICALSSAASLYLIQELDRPYGGLITISSEPLRDALTVLTQ